MSEAFTYRPKFVDIRVKRGAEKAAPNRAPAEHACDHVGCKSPGEHRAPKGRDRANEFWHFCLEHAADYNRRWNYFSGMSDSEMADFQKQAETGHRPTWTFRAGKGDRMAATASNVRSGKRTNDPFGMFGATGAEAERKPQRNTRRLTRLQTLSLEALSLDENADGPAIRARYAELVKRWHPDSNGGDRGAEANLQRVVKAYQTLKAGGLV